MTTPARIIKEVAKSAGITPETLISASRKRPLPQLRWHAMLRLRYECGMKLEAIAFYLGRTDHTTVLHGLKRAIERLEQATGKPFVPCETRIPRHALGLDRR